jgi:hypothetical protein
MSHVIRLAVLPLFALALAGCGSYVVVKLPPPARAVGASFEVGEVTTVVDDVPPAFLDRLSSAVQAQLLGAGRLAQPGDSNVYRVNLTVTEFYDRNAVGRILVGPLAGSDDAEATAQLVQPTDGQLAAEWQAYAYNGTNWGDTDNVVNALAEKILSGLLQCGP